MLVQDSPTSLLVQVPCGIESKSFSLAFSARAVPGYSKLTIRHDMGKRVVFDIGDENGLTVFQERFAARNQELPTCLLEISAQRGLAVHDAQGVLLAKNASLPKFSFTGVHWATDGQESAVVRLRTQPPGVVDVSPLRRAAELAALISVVAALLITVRRSYRGLQVALRNTGNSATRNTVFAIDVIVGIACVTASVFVRSVDDDGWVISTARALRFGHEYFNYYEPVAYPNGFLFSVAYAYLGATSSTVIGLRGMSVACAFLGWLVFRGLFRAGYGGARDHRSALVAGACVWIIFVTAWWTSLRPEVVVALLLLLVLLCGLRWCQTRSNVYVLLALLIGGLGMGIHQTGLCIVFALIPLVVLVIKGILFDGRCGRLLASCIVAAGCIGAVLLATYPYNLPQFLRYASDYQTFFPASAALGPLDEFARYANFSANGLTSDNPAARFSLVLIVLGMGGALWSLIVRQPSGVNPSRIVSAMILAAPFGLLLTTSKWNWHYAALGPVAALGVAALCSSSFSRSRRDSVVASRVLFLVVTLSGCAWAVVPYLERFPGFASWKPQLIIVFLISAFLAISTAASLRERGKMYVGVLVVSTIIIVAPFVEAILLPSTVAQAPGSSLVLQQAAGDSYCRSRTGTGVVTAVSTTLFLQVPCVTIPTPAAGVWSVPKQTYGSLFLGQEKFLAETEFGITDGQGMTPLDPLPSQ